MKKLGIVIISLILGIGVLGQGRCSSSYTASPETTTSGGGTWGSLFEMSVEINSSEGTFMVKKQEGCFESSGTMYLKVGTYEPFGVDHCSKSVFPGDCQIVCTDNFDEYPDDTYPKEYYYRYEADTEGYDPECANDSGQGGCAWVGPITISKN